MLLAGMDLRKLKIILFNIIPVLSPRWINIVSFIQNCVMFRHEETVNFAPDKWIVCIVIKKEINQVLPFSLPKNSLKKTNVMKKLLFALVVPVMMLAAGCNQSKQEVAMLKATNDSLITIGMVKDSTVADFVNAINDIQSNLDSIKMKERIISNVAGKNSELKSKAKDQINSDINLIYKLQLENKALVASLRSKLNKSSVRTVEMERMIDNLSIQIEEKDVQIAQLKDDLAKVNIQVTDLTTKVVDLNTNVENLNTLTQQKQQVIEAKTAELNTAYYVVGTSSFLKEKKIVTKEGGFIGIGTKKELTPELNKNYLTKVDITQLSVVPIMKSKATILSSHPKNSYRLTGKSLSDSLVITNQKEFWSLSKVLVVNVK